MTDLQRAKVVVELTLQTTFEFSDDGYLGVEASIADHVKMAREKMANCQVLIRQGATDPKPVNVRYEVTGVHISPKE